MTFMKQLFLLLAFTCITSASFAVVGGGWSSNHADQLDIQALPPEVKNMDLNHFLQLTPKQYEQITGEKLNFTQRIALKAAQRHMKHESLSSASIPQVLYVVLAIFGLAWLAMGIMDNWTGNNWWINLLLTLLFWLPGLIHALIVMGDYY